MFCFVFFFGFFLFYFFFSRIDLLLLESTYVHNFREKAEEKMLLWKQIINMKENMKSLQFLVNKICARFSF